MQNAITKAHRNLEQRNPETLQLLFLESQESMPYPAKSYVCIGGPYSRGKNEEPLLTPECFNTTELNCWIDDLKRQLDEIKKEAQRKYAAYERRVESSHA